MTGFSRLAAAAALFSACALAACAASGGDNASSPSAPDAQSQNAGETGAYTDAQVQAFVAARSEIQQLTPGTTAEAQAQNQMQISQILLRHSLAPDVYNAIVARAQTDQGLANRIAAASVGTEFTDAQLQSFLAAGAEIQPLSQQLATATPEQQTALADQIRLALSRHNLTIEQFNGIAAQAQTDTELAARINALNAPAPPE